MQKPFSHFSSESVIERNKWHTSYKLALPEGEGSACIYRIMPGVEIVEIDLKAPGYAPVLHEERDVLEINHCLKGRVECRMSDGCLQYIGEHDIFLSTLHNHSERIDLPLGHYRGIAVMLDRSQAVQGIETHLSDVSFNLKALLERLFTEDECFLIQANEKTRRIFSGMYTIPEEARNVYYRLKVLELLLYLHYLDPDKVPQKPVYARQQVEIIKQVHKQLTDRPGQRFTIEELAHSFGMSTTLLKSVFKEVYGIPIASYMKVYRIRKAAELLRTTSMSVAEIATEMGYGSPSKFSAAFREQMTLNPLEYRKR